MRRGRLRRSAEFLAAGAGLALAVAGCGISSPRSTAAHSGASGQPETTGATPAAPATAPSSPTTAVTAPAGGAAHVWIFSAEAFSQVTTDPVAAARLRNDTIYLITRGTEVPAGYHIVPTAGFRSVADLQKAFRDRSLPADTKAVLYDNENWSFTPASEQRDPADAYAQAASLAHGHGLQLVATPADDLTRVLDPTQAQSDPLQAYRQTGLAALARGADVFDIQAQRFVGNLPMFTALVRQAAQDARHANPDAVVVAGLSTCAANPTSDQLVAAAEASAPYVSGWWMNVPGGGPSAPNCRTADPGLAESFIDALPGA